MALGCLIALEGIDGSGTTTQVPGLATYLRSQGHAVVTTAQPSQGAAGVMLRQALGGAHDFNEASLALLFAADRLDHLAREIEPALATGAVVITDRYILSSYAYQGCYLPMEWVAAINSRARTPDATFFFRVSPDTAAERRRARHGPTEQFDGMARQKRVAQRYEDALALSRFGRIFVVDGEATVDAVAEQLRKHINTLLHGDG